MHEERLERLWLDIYSQPTARDVYSHSLHQARLEAVSEALPVQVPANEDHAVDPLLTRQPALAAVAGAGGEAHEHVHGLEDKPAKVGGWGKWG